MPEVLQRQMQVIKDVTMMQTQEKSFGMVLLLLIQDK